MGASRPEIERAVPCCDADPVADQAARLEGRLLGQRWAPMRSSERPTRTDPKGLKMQPVYHFTDSTHLPWILSDGELKPGANRIGGYPALWRAVAVSQVLPAGFCDLARSSS